MMELRDQLDARIEIVTPENIAFQYRVAGPFRRGIAYLIDLGIRVVAVAIVVVVVSIFFSAAGLWGLGAAVGLLIYFVLDWFYGGLFETYWNGQTPGKRLLQMRVLSVTGQPVSGWQAILRNVLRAVDVAPVALFFIPTGQFALFTMAANRRFQRFGDMLSGTMVVVEEPARLFGVQRITDPAALQLAMEIPARFRVSRGLGRALSAYVARRTALGWARRSEIARHVGEPLRVKFGLPQGTNHDLLLCALYHRAFIADVGGDEPPPSPFQQSQPAGELEVPTSLVMRDGPPPLPVAPVDEIENPEPEAAAAPGST
jgi:uncharacterized RDD family membrane protein YckC